MQQVPHLLHSTKPTHMLSLPTACLKCVHTSDLPPKLLKVNSPVFIFFFTSSSSMLHLGECAFCSWKYSHYFELLKKHKTRKLDQGPGPPWPKNSDRKCQPDRPVGQGRVRAENLNSNSEHFTFPHFAMLQPYSKMD